MKNTTLHRLTAAVMAVLLITTSSVAFIGAGAAQSDELEYEAGSDGAVFAPDVLELATWSGFEPDNRTVTYGVSAHPGWIIHYSEEENGSSALQEWVSDSTERNLIHHSEDSAWMLVSAPADDIGVSSYHRLIGRYLTTSLSQQSYVEHVDLNRELRNVEPISVLANQSTFSSPKYGSAATLGGLRGSFTPDGVAYSGDANRTTMLDARGSINATESSLTGDNVTVAVIDTGLTYDESLYQGRIIAGKNTLTGEEANVTLYSNNTANLSASDYSALKDGNGHGSFVTSQIAANSSNNTFDGVAPDSRIISVKALGDDGSGSTASIARALEYACSQGADVVSMSLGSYAQQPTVREEMEECFTENGVSAIALAAGNERTSYRWVSTPADTQELPVIAVAATNGEAAAQAESAYFSNVGPDPLADGAAPTVAAPGMRIVAQTDTGAEELSGTSMATPIVSGSLALLLEAQPSLVGDEEEIHSRLTRTAAPIPHAGSTEVGAGMVDVSALLADVEPAQSQEEARTEDATARDSANSALSGSLIRQLFEGEWL